MEKGSQGYDSNVLNIVNGCYQITKCLERQMEEAVGNKDMTSDEIYTLLYLATVDRKCTSSELTAKLPFSASKLTRITKKLLKKMMISEKISHEDRRSILIDITIDGLKVVEGVEDKLNKKLDKMCIEFANMSSEAFAEVIEELRQVSEAIKND